MYVVRRLVHSYNAPLDDMSLDRMTKKTFSDESLKKIHWVRRMYSQWRDVRNTSGNQEFISCDLEDLVMINVPDFVFAVCHFITEVKQMNGDDFPAKTLYDLVICTQIHLETLGFTWKILNDDDFVDLKIY